MSVQDAAGADHGAAQPKVADVGAATVVVAGAWAGESSLCGHHEAAPGRFPPGGGRKPLPAAEKLLGRLWLSAPQAPGKYLGDIQRGGFAACG